MSVMLLFGKGVVIVYRACALSLGFNTVLSICPISGIHTGGGGTGISAQSPNLPPPPLFVCMFCCSYNNNFWENLPKRSETTIEIAKSRQ